MSSASKKWPIGPLQAAVEALPRGIEAIGKAHGLTKSKAYKYSDLYRIGVREGFITLRTMDGICVDILRKHPIEVYGKAYFDPKYDAGHVGKPCITCGGPKEPGAAHRCAACREKVPA